MRYIYTLALILTVAFTGCVTTNTTPPDVNNQAALSGSSFSVHLGEPLTELSIVFDRRSLGGAGLIGGIEMVVTNSSKEDAKEIMDKLQSDESLRGIEKFICEDLCDKLGKRCTDGEDGLRVSLRPVFVGYRFDQMHNVKYVPSYVVEVTVSEGSQVVFFHRIGSGNLDRMGSMRRLGIRADLGFRKPHQILEDAKLSIENLYEVISEVNSAVVEYLAL